MFFFQLKQLFDSNKVYLMIWEGVLRRVLVQQLQPKQQML